MFDSGEGRQLKVLNITSAESTAVVAYLITLEYGINDQKSSGECACTSTWVKEDHNWVCALHTESDLKK